MTSGLRRQLVAALLVRGDRVLLCHRSPARQWFPDVWDLPGGHLEPGETAAEALVRELREELGVEIAPPGAPSQRVVTDAFDLDVWRVDTWSGVVRNIAPAEHDAIGWFSRAEVAELPLADERIRPIVDRVLTTRIHLAALLPAPACDEVQVARRKWDPAMADLVPPHVTVAYPEEAPDADLLVTRMASLATDSFALRLTTVVADDEGRGGVFAVVEDLEGGWRSLRAELLRPPFVDSGYPPHVTLAHPRTMRDGPAAYQALRDTRWDLPVAIDEIVLTETGHDFFRVLQRFPLS